MSQSGARVSDEQAALLQFALENQRSEIATALGALARDLGFREEAADDVGRGLERPDVLRVVRRRGRVHLFVGVARSFAEPVHDPRHHELVRAWLRRFARLVDDRRGKRTARIASGYVMIGAYDDASAAAWASALTRMARPLRLHRDGDPARFVVQKLDRFWVAC